jgi:hypothetical protein
VILTPSRALALVEYVHGNEAKAAFGALNYSRFKHTPLKLEWAPVKVLSGESAGAVAARTGEAPSEPTLSTMASTTLAEDTKAKKKSEEGEEAVGGKRKTNPKADDAVTKFTPFFSHLFLLIIVLRILPILAKAMERRYSSLISTGSQQKKRTHKTKGLFCRELTLFIL